MKNITFHSTIALLLGALSMYSFFALIGVVKVLSMKLSIHNWIFKLPKSLQQTSLLVCDSLEGLIVAILIFGLFGLLLGAIIENRPLLFGLIQYGGALTFYFLYHYVELHRDFLWMDDVPAWTQIFPFCTWLLIFPCASLIGNRKLKRLFTH